MLSRIIGNTWGERTLKCGTRELGTFSAKNLFFGLVVEITDSLSDAKNQNFQTEADIILHPSPERATSTYVRHPKTDLPSAGMICQWRSCSKAIPTLFKAQLPNFPPKVGPGSFKFCKQAERSELYLRTLNLSLFSRRKSGHSSRSIHPAHHPENRPRARASQPRGPTLG